MATRIGTNGADVIGGTEARDRLIGRGGDDQISGLGGSDVIQGDAGADTILGGRGRDQIAGGSGGDEITDLAGANRVLGGTDDDTLLATGFVDGGAGDDFVSVLVRGSRLAGGDGADIFALAELFDGGRPLPPAVDRITDFDQAEGDVISLVFALAAITAPSVEFVGTGPFTGGLQARYEVRGSNTFVLVETGLDPQPDFVTRLDGVFTLAADDFILG